MGMQISNRHEHGLTCCEAFRSAEAACCIKFEGTDHVAMSPMSLCFYVLPSAMCLSGQPKPRC